MQELLIVRDSRDPEYFGVYEVDGKRFIEQAHLFSDQVRGMLGREVLLELYESKGEPLKIRVSADIVLETHNAR